MSFTVEEYNRQNWTTFSTRPGQASGSCPPLSANRGSDFSNFSPFPSWLQTLSVGHPSGVYHSIMIRVSSTITYSSEVGTGEPLPYIYWNQVSYTVSRETFTSIQSHQFSAASLEKPFWYDSECTVLNNVVRCYNVVFHNPRSTPLSVLTATFHRTSFYSFQLEGYKTQGTLCSCHISFRPKMFVELSINTTIGYRTLNTRVFSPLV